MRKTESCSRGNQAGRLRRQSIWHGLCSDDNRKDILVNHAA